MTENRNSMPIPERTDAKKASDARKEMRRAPYSGDDTDPTGQTPDNIKRRERAEKRQ